MISKSPRAIHLKKYVKWMPYIIFLYGLLYVILLLVFGNISSIIYGLILLVISLFFTYKGKKIFSRLIGFKSYYAALTWAALIPFAAIYISYPINLTVFLFSFFVFIRLLVNINFFDIKDMVSDSKDEIRTLVLGLGKEAFISLLHILNLVSMLPIIIGILLDIFPVYSFCLVFLFFYSYIFIIRGRENIQQIQNISYIVVDGEYYYWPILLFIMLLFGVV
jgi:1,4-dihydroxy-2-naphthoate octaprenyltransferase